MPATSITCTEKSSGALSATAGHQVVQLRTDRAAEQRRHKRKRPSRVQHALLLYTCNGYDLADRVPLPELKPILQVRILNLLMNHGCRHGLSAVRRHSASEPRSTGGEIGILLYPAFGLAVW